MVKTRRIRLNKNRMLFRPKSDLFPFGGISILLLERGENVRSAGGAKYYLEPDGRVTMVLNKVMSDEDPTKRASHTFDKKEWKILPKKK